MGREHNGLKALSRASYTAMLAVFLPMSLFGIKSCEELQRIENAKVACEAEIKEISAVKDELIAEIDVLTQSQTDLELSCQQYESEIAALVVKKAEIQNVIHVLNETILGLETDKSLLESDIEQLNIEKDELSNELAEIAARIDREKFSTEFFFVSKDGDVDDEYISIVYNELSLLPQSVINLYQDKGVKIYVTTKNIAKEILNGQYSSVQGVTLYGRNTIYIEDRKIACESATLHECGHLFNEYMGYVVRQKDLQDIYWEEEKAFGRIAGAYCSSNIDEYFAEAFAMYFKDRLVLYAHCPKTGQYIENLIEGIE